MYHMFYVCQALSYKKTGKKTVAAFSGSFAADGRQDGGGIAPAEPFLLQNFDFRGNAGFRARGTCIARADRHEKKGRLEKDIDRPD